MRYRHLTAALSLAVVLLCAFTALGQSGRRQKQPPPAAPVPTPTPEPTPVPKKETAETDTFILVGADRSGSFSIPITYYDAAVRGCADKMKKVSSAVVDAAPRDLSRGEAIKKAKEDMSYVVLISLAYDSMARSQDDIIVEFVVFMPETGKVLLTGRSYLNSNRSGPLVVNRPGRIPGGLYREELFRLAGEDAADRILKKMNLAVPK